MNSDFKLLKDMYDNIIRRQRENIDRLNDITNDAEEALDESLEVIKDLQKKVRYERRLNWFLTIVVLIQTFIMWRY